MVEGLVRNSHTNSVPSETLRAMHTGMLRIRVFEETVAQLVETNEIKTPTHLYIGQEAVAVGVCASLRSDDYVLGNHRSHGHYLAKGGNLKSLMAEMFCRAGGCSKGRGGSMHLFAGDVGVIGTVPMVAATIPIAVGAALSSVMQKSDRVAVAFFGDGATEEGVFHEALNFAALKNLPVIFVCENNLYSSHLTLRERRPMDDLARIAEPYGIPGLQVDGNDVEAVYLASKAAVEKARSGAGPSLIECRTYRWRGHVGPSFDLDVGIREREELDYWMSRCPIRAVEEALVRSGLISEEDLAATRARVQEEVEIAVELARRSPPLTPTDVLRHVFVE